MPNLGPMELIIILVIALLLFGGSRLAGVGKGVGRSIREFKEEVKSDDKPKPADPVVTDPQLERPRPADQVRYDDRPRYDERARSDVYDAEIVQPEVDPRDRH